MDQLDKKARRTSKKEQQEEDDILAQLEDHSSAIPRNSLCQKISTIDIRKEVTKLYDEASMEVERDMSLDLDALVEIQETSARQRRLTSESDSSAQKEEGNHVYEHVALSEPGARYEIVDGKMVAPPWLVFIRHTDLQSSFPEGAEEMHSLPHQ